MDRETERCVADAGQPRPAATAERFIDFPLSIPTSVRSATAM